MPTISFFHPLGLVLLVISILSAVGNWLVVVTPRLQGGPGFAWRLTTKAVMMVCLLAWVLFSLNFRPGLRAGWFAAGLVFCLAGDVLLELPPKKWFRLGLFAFLIGQVCYIFGFGSLYPPGAKPLGPLLVIVLILAAVNLIVPRLLRGVEQGGQEKMKIPLSIYAACISLMLYSAVITLFDARWSGLESALVAVGALLFYTSDIINAWARFVHDFPRQRLFVMTTYHLAQLGIQLGVVLHFSRLLP